MRASTHLKTRASLVLALAAAGLTPWGSVATAATPTLELCAVAGTTAPLPVTQPGLTVPIWGFGIPSTPGDCSTASASLPGPLLSVAEGDVVTVVLHNVLARTVSFEVAGLDFGSGGTEAGPGGTLARTFTATRPGTYLYQSAGDAGRQQAMGMYGVLVVRSATAGQAYDAASTAYDVDAPLVLSALDPAFNANPDTADLRTYRATYWLVNGRSYPDTVPVTAAVGARVLLRYVNAGYDNTTMQLLGMHQRVLARDAGLLNNPFLAAAETIPAGATEDTVATVPSGGAPSANGFALFNRQLHVTNGAAGSVGHYPGGMLTFVRVP